MRRGRGLWGCNQKKGGGGLDVIGRKVGGKMRGSKRRRRGRGEEERRDKEEEGKRRGGGGKRRGRGGWVDEGMHHSDERVRRPCTRARVHTSACVHMDLPKKV